VTAKPDHYYRINRVSMSSQRKYYVKLSVVVYAIWLAAYEIVGHYVKTLPTIDLTGFIDRQIPLIPEFVWAYAFCYIYPFVPLFVTVDWHRYNRGLIAMAIANITAFAVYILYPVAMPRVPLGDSISEKLLGFIYWLDFKPAVTELPSLHVFFAWLVYLMSRKQRLNQFGDAVLFSIAAAITVSTLFVKQHFVLDVVAGLIWATGSWLLAGLLYSRLADPALEPAVALRQVMARLSPSTLFSGLMLAIRRRSHSN